MVIVGGPEARVTRAEGVLKRVFQHRRAHVEEGLHGGSVPIGINRENSAVRGGHCT